MATSFSPLRIRQELGSAAWGPPAPFGGDGWVYQHRHEHSSIVVTCATHPDGTAWVHASISHRDRMPDYADLRRLHRAVFGDGWAYQVFAPPSEHVNIHEHALHLFGRLDGRPALPDFTLGSGSI
jgi:hypothetical protein